MHRVNRVNQMNRIHLVNRTPVEMGRGSGCPPKGVCDAEWPGRSAPGPPFRGRPSALRHIESIEYRITQPRHFQIPAPLRSFRHPVIRPCLLIRMQSGIHTVIRNPQAGRPAACFHTGSVFGCGLGPGGPRFGCSQTRPAAFFALDPFFGQEACREGFV